MLLDHSDIQTKEVLNWKGFNLLHFAGSACSQKLRIFLNLKGIDWISHHIDLTKNEQFDSWYLGINPRGLVPTLVHNGNVHIESNDIMQYIESVNTDVVLFPNERGEKEAYGSGRSTSATTKEGGPSRKAARRGTQNEGGGRSTTASR